jgi:hypothetical protein
MSSKRSRIAAGESARRLILQEKIDVASLDATMRDMGDHWAFVFELVVPEGEVWDPSTVIVDVDKATGAAKFFPAI